MSEEPSEADQVWSLRLTQRARTDIETAYVSLSERISVNFADTWQEGLEEAIASLSRLPERCLAAPEADYFPPPLVRQLLYRRAKSKLIYRVLFRLHEDANDAPFVRLIAVRHSGQAPINEEEAKQIREAE